MGNDSTDVMLARLQERIETLLTNQAEHTREQKEMSQRLWEMESRLKNVENSLSTSKPVIDEFITIKHKVVGAGQFGKWVWVAAASFITFLLTSREKVFHFFAGT